MADTKISALAAGTPAQAADLIPIARGAANFSLTVADILGNGTSGRVPFYTAGGLQAGSANFTFVSPVLTLGVSGSVAGQMLIANSTNVVGTPALKFGATGTEVVMYSQFASELTIAFGATNSYAINTSCITISGPGAGSRDLGSANSGWRRLYVDATITAGGATGNKTINKASGSIRIAAAGTTATLTDSLITANTIVLAQLSTADTTAKSVVVAVSATSAVFTLNAASTAEVEIRWFIVNSD